MEDKNPKDVELVHEALHEPAQVARYLRALADGIELGRLRLRSGEREIELHPASLCTFELRSQSERQRVKLQVQLRWREVAVGTEANRLEIASE